MTDLRERNVNKLKNKFIIRKSLTFSKCLQGFSERKLEPEGTIRIRLQGGKRCSGTTITRAVPVVWLLPACQQWRWTDKKSVKEKRRRESRRQWVHQVILYACACQSHTSRLSCADVSMSAADPVSFRPVLARHPHACRYEMTMTTEWKKVLWSRHQFFNHSQFNTILIGWYTVFFFSKLESIISYSATSGIGNPTKIISSHRK